MIVFETPWQNLLQMQELVETIEGIVGFLKLNLLVIKA